MEMSSLRVVEDQQGNVWIMLRERVLLFISKDGDLCASNDVIANADIPDPPP